MQKASYYLSLLLFEHSIKVWQKRNLRSRSYTNTALTIYEVNTNEVNEVHVLHGSFSKFLWAWIFSFKYFIDKPTRFLLIILEFEIDFSLSFFVCF